LRGKQIEAAFEKLLTDAGIRWKRNPYTNTPDPRRALYDHEVLTSSGSWLQVEEKGNHAARETGNCAIEEDILAKSEASRFLIAFPVPAGWHGQIIDRQDIENLLKETTLTTSGRVHKYKRVHTGQWEDTISALVPIPDLMRYGESVGEFIKYLAA
jgi:hypothetical protein